MLQWQSTSLLETKGEAARETHAAHPSPTGIFNAYYFQQTSPNCSYSAEAPLSMALPHKSSNNCMEGGVCPTAPAAARLSSNAATK